MNNQYLVEYEMLSGDEAWLPGLVSRFGSMRQAEEFCKQRLRLGKVRNMRIHVMECVQTIAYEAKE